MKKFTIFASAAALAFVVMAPIASPQDYRAFPFIALADHSMSASKLIGTQVSDNQGASIGTIVDVLVKAEAAEPTVVVSVGDYVGNGAKMVRVPLSHVKVEGMRAMMPGATKQMMTNMPPFKFEGLNGSGG
jgi:sporulation protein YlmC with PRC-barrel domain